MSLPVSLPVGYPHGGFHYLLHWYSDEDRGHIILARTEHSIAATAKRVFEEYTDVSIKAYCTIDIVGPSARMCTLAAKERRQEKVRSFQREITHHMREANKIGLPLPPMFAPCEKFEPEEADTREDEWVREGHYGCRHCLDTIRLVWLTPDMFYDRYYAAWLGMNPDHRDNHQAQRQRRGPSRVTSAKDNEILSYVRSSFGHHQDGLCIRTLKSPEPEPDTLSDQGYTHSYLDGDTLFFFRHLQDINTEGLQAILDEAKATADARERRREQDDKNRFERERRAETLWAVRFFDEMTK